MTTTMNPAVFHLLCLRQGDRAIEEYVSNFCGLCNLVDFNAMALKGIFRNGLKDCLYDLMPDNACSVTLEEYINHALFLAGSSFTVGIADADPADAELGPVLIASVMDPPLMSVRAAGIPRASALAVTETVPLTSVLPVMAVANLCVWAAHCTPEASSIHKSAPEPPEVAASAPEPPEVAGPLQNHQRWRLPLQNLPMW